MISFYNLLSISRSVPCECYPRTVKSKPDIVLRNLTKKIIFYLKITTVNMYARHSLTSSSLPNCTNLLGRSGHKFKLNVELLSTNNLEIIFCNPAIILLKCLKSPGAGQGFQVTKSDRQFDLHLSHL